MLDRLISKLRKVQCPLDAWPILEAFLPGLEVCPLVVAERHLALIAAYVWLPADKLSWQLHRNVLGL